MAKSYQTSAYYYATGGVYQVQVSFKGKQAIIHFGDGNQVTIRLNQRAIGDSKIIEGYGKFGQVPVNDGFSVGLVHDSSVGDGQLPQANPLEGMWRIEVEKL